MVGNQYIAPGTTITFVDTLIYEATITWRNTEQTNHYVEIWVTGTGAPTTVHLAVRNAESIRIPIQRWWAQDNSTADRTVTINVKVKSATDESTVATASRTISLSEVGSIPSAPGLFVLSEERGDLLLPAHSGLRQTDVPYGSISFSPLGTTPAIAPVADVLISWFVEPQSSTNRYGRLSITNSFGYDASAIVAGPTFTGGFAYSGIAAQPLWFGVGGFGGALLDGGFYKAVASFNLAATPINSLATTALSNVRQWTNLTTTVTREAVFEYWAKGTPAPKITSPATITVNVGDSISYLVVATSPIGVPSVAANLGTTGLAFNSSTQRITGSFSTAGTRTITVSATNTYGTTTKTVTIVVNVATPVITSPLTATVVAGMPFTYNFTATNATSFSVNLNSVPGISYNAATQQITGAFTSGGVKSITLTASNADATTTQTLNVTVAIVTPAFTSALTADNVAGLPFTYTLAANDATTFSVAFGTVTGLTYDSGSRRISGTLTAAGTYNVSLTASNAYASKTETLVITSRVVTPLIGGGSAGITGQRSYIPVSITRNGTTATVTVLGGSIGNPAGHLFKEGELVNIVGCAQSAYNGTFVILSVLRPLISVASVFTYEVSGSPATPATAATPDGILAGPGALTLNTRAGDPIEYQLVIRNATASAVSFGTSTGLSYSPETQRITGEFTSVDPVQTLRITASNLLANATRDLTVNVAIPQPRVTSVLQTRAITGQPFSYVLNTVDATSVAVSFGTAIGLTYDAANRTLSGVFAETQAGQQVVSIALANEFASKNEQLVITVEVPRLQDPKNVAVSLLHRVWAAPGRQTTVYGSELVPPNKFDLYGLVTWENTEPRTHNVILTVAGRRTTRPSGSTSALVYLASWTAPEVAAKTVNIGVQLTGTEFSSTLVTSNVSVNAAAAAEFTGELAVRSDANFDPANALLVPGWNGALDRNPATYLNQVYIEYTPPDQFLFLRRGDEADRFLAQNPGAFEAWNQPRGSGALLIQVPGKLTAGAEVSTSGTDELGKVTYDLSDEVVSGDYYFTSVEQRALDLPGRLIGGAVYRAELRVATGAVLPKSSTYQITWEGLSGTRRIPPQYVTRQHYNVAMIAQGVSELPLGTALSKSLFFTAPALTVPFTATGPSGAFAINRPARIPLVASRRATWTIDSIQAANGSAANLPEFGIEYDPPVFGTSGPERAYLVGSPSTAGVFRFNMTARSGSENASATGTVSLVASLPRTTISTNSTITRDGWKAKVGDELSLAFSSNPPTSLWTATGLPPGVRLNQDGTIIGRFTKGGNYLATISAQGIGTSPYDPSLPTTIKFTIEAGSVALEDYSAAGRSPWLLSEWQLIDLHVLARSREVQSTMFEGGALRIKVGDALNFGIFFVDAADNVFELAPSRLRLTIRKADNLDDLMIFKGAEPPVAVESNFQTYYELNVVTGSREREVALEWAEENEKNEPLKCVADLDWVKDGKNYSSRTFPVILELDVTRP
jgi:PKD repeat protein